MLKIFCQNRLSPEGCGGFSFCFLSHNSLFHSLTPSITLLTYHCHCPSLWISMEGAFVLCCHKYCEGQTNYVITISHHIINITINLDICHPNTEMFLNAAFQGVQGNMSNMRSNIGFSFIMTTTVNVNILNQCFPIFGMHQILSTKCLWVQRCRRTWVIRGPILGAFLAGNSCYILHRTNNININPWCCTMVDDKSHILDKPHIGQEGYSMQVCLYLIKQC